MTDRTDHPAMKEQTNATTSFLNILAEIRPQFFRQKERAIHLAEQMLKHQDTSYIPQILSCFPVDRYYLHQLDADMRRLRIICEITAAEEMLPGTRSLFLKNVDSFDSLIQKYITITFLLRRLELPLPEGSLEETSAILQSGLISVCALRKVTECETFANPEYVYQQALRHLSL